jgi:adenine/guanine phosphoribosyltransferase-like PRPP-binding protein
MDDFVGMGGTLANLRGYIESKGGKVIAATVLTGKQFSAKIALNRTTLQEVRNKHGKELENS